MELLRALGSLIEVPAPQHARIAAAAGLPEVPGPDVQGTVVEFQRYPYASVYLGPEGMMGGDARDRIAGFRRALGVADRAAPGDGHGPGHSLAGTDHLASLLALLGSLEQWRAEEPHPARAALLEEARVTLYWEHLASWMVPYLTAFEGCGEPFYEAWASLLDEVLAEVAEGMELPDFLPRALRDAPALADPRDEGGAAFIASLLAPVRSGMILLRDDLVRLGEHTGMACRAGERRYVLGEYFAQDPGTALGWLSGHAAEWARRVAPAGPPRVAQWWAGRAGESGALLADLATGVDSAANPVPGTVG